MTMQAFTPIPANATAQDAVRAYQRFISSDYCTPLDITDADEVADLRDAMDEWRMETPVPVAAATLHAIEAAQGWRFPPALAAFYEQVGSFAVNDIRGLRLLAPANSYEFLNTFDNHGYDRSHTEFTQLLSPTQLEALRAQFFFFGIGFFEDDGASSRLLYFHKQEAYFGELLILESNHPRMAQTEYAQLFAHTAPRYSWDALLGLQLNRLMVYSLYNTNAIDESMLDEQALQWLHESEMYRY